MRLVGISLVPSSHRELCGVGEGKGLLLARAGFHETVNYTGHSRYFIGCALF